MPKYVKHVIIPVCLTLVFFVVGFTPVEVLGCRTRGLLVFGIAMFSGIAGIVSGIVGLKARIQKNPDSNWWLVSTVLLTIPVAAMVVLA